MAEKKWFKGDTHLHTINSDGILNPDAMSMYKRFACGMAKAVATPMARLI